MMQSVVVSGHFPMWFWPLPPPLPEPFSIANAQSQRQSLFNLKNKMNTIVEIDTLVSKINNTVDIKLQTSLEMTTSFGNDDHNESTKDFFL